MKSTELLICHGSPSVLSRLDLVESDVPISVDQEELSLIELPCFSSAVKDNAHLISALLRDTRESPGAMVALMEVAGGEPLSDFSRLVMRLKSESVRIRLGRSQHRILGARVEERSSLLEFISELHLPDFGSLVISLGSLGLLSLRGYCSQNEKLVLRDGLLPLLCNSLLRGESLLSVELDYKPKVVILTTGEVR